MTNEQEMWTAFLAGYTASRTRGIPTIEVNSLTERTARQIFDGWYEKNYHNGEGMGCPTCPAGPEHIHEGSEETVCQSCGCVLVER